MENCGAEECETVSGSGWRGKWRCDDATRNETCYCARCSEEELHGCGELACSIFEFGSLVGEPCSRVFGEKFGCPIVGVAESTWDEEIRSCKDLCEKRVGGTCTRAAYASSDRCTGENHEEYELACEEDLRDSGILSFKLGASVT